MSKFLCSHGNKNRRVEKTGVFPILIFLQIPSRLSRLFEIARHALPLAIENQATKRIAALL